MIVNDPSRAPEEHNISMIYEMKFNESVNEEQVRAYRRIVNFDAARVETIEIKDCHCEKRKEKIRQMTHVEMIAWAAAISALIAAQKKKGGDGGMSPELASTGLAIIGAIAFGFLTVAVLPEAAVVSIGAFIARILIAGGTAGGTAVLAH